MSRSRFACQPPLTARIPPLWLAASAHPPMASSITPESSDVPDTRRRHDPIRHVTVRGRNRRDDFQL